MGRRVQREVSQHGGGGGQIVLGAGDDSRGRVVGR